MKDCVFCKIIAGELPCFKVYEDELFLGFLDITPRTRGHSLLIPKKHYQWVYDVVEFDKYWLAVNKITNNMKRVLAPYFVTYATHGLEVPHAHIHILPRQKTDTAFVPDHIRVSKEEMQKLSRLLLNKSSTSS